MAYADLNPVRANLSATPETAEHTSIKERLKPIFNFENAIKLQVNQQCLQSEVMSARFAPKPLAKFEGDISQKNQFGILFSLQDYIELVDYTGRLFHPNKRGHISETLPPILHRLNLDQKSWLEQATKFKDYYPKKFAKPSARKLNLTD
jgi:hypothetical protein